MKSVVELEIEAPQDDVAELLADPRRTPEWMDDIERIEPISGVLGEPGSRYRLVPRRGSMIFTATVLAQNLPAELGLRLDSPTAAVTVDVRLLALADGNTRLISEENFTFSGIVSRMLGLVAGGAIKRAHRHHMEAFKRLVEGRAVL